MMNSLVYLTRKCPRKCSYCKLRDSKLTNPELTKEQWVDAFYILKDLGVNFNLILGNETWLLGEDLLYIMERNKIPFALYTTCPEGLFEKYRDTFFRSGVIDNLSCGIDYPFFYLRKTLTEKGQFNNDMELKSYTAWKGLLWTKEHYPQIDCQGTITISKYNYSMLSEIVEELHQSDIFCGLNFLHWDIDGKYDFFPKKEELQPFLLVDSEKNILDKYLKALPSNNSIQNYEMVKEDINRLSGMGWHCDGNPYGGPTIDSDGSCRCCGYRAGENTSQFSIFDLRYPSNIKRWREAVIQDCKECPGCFWSYPWMFHYWEKNNKNFGKDVFIKHAGYHIPKEKWSERTIEECVE